PLSFSCLTTTHSYTPSLHDALPISFPMSRLFEISITCRGALCAAVRRRSFRGTPPRAPAGAFPAQSDEDQFGRNLLEEAEFEAPDRKSTRLNSSHQIISYAVFCLKK